MCDVAASVDSCPQLWAKCANGYQCYEQAKGCDEKPDCLDQSDEWNCLCTFSLFIASKAV